MAMAIQTPKPDSDSTKVTPLLSLELDSASTLT